MRIAFSVADVAAGYTVAVDDIGYKVAVAILNDDHKLYSQCEHIAPSSMALAAISVRHTTHLAMLVAQS